jgi:DNA-directed RNA polymerase III subunit RPC3
VVRLLHTFCPDDFICIFRHVDLRKAYSVLLGGLYKTLYNISIRRRAEEEDPSVRAVLDKRERSDVSEDETLLTRMEREVLQEWEKKQQKFTVLELRVEEAVFILRDLVSGEE